MSRRLSVVVWGVLAAACGGGAGPSLDGGGVALPSRDTFSVGGRVDGLQGTGLQLALNGGSEIPIQANGTFWFPLMAPGTAYQVSVARQPWSPVQECTVQQGRGTLGMVDVDAVRVVCRTPMSFPVGGVVEGLAGTGLKLSLNGSQELEIFAPGPFAFPREVERGQAFAVELVRQPTQPAQTCTVVGARGQVGGGPVTSIFVYCSENAAFTVGGKVTGLNNDTQVSLSLLREGRVLREVTLGANGPYVFPLPMQPGDRYFVVVSRQPSIKQVCTTVNSEGTIDMADVRDLDVVCVPYW